MFCFFIFFTTEETLPFLLKRYNLFLAVFHEKDE